MPCAPGRSSRIRCVSADRQKSASSFRIASRVQGRSSTRAAAGAGDKVGSSHTGAGASRGRILMASWCDGGQGGRLRPEPPVRTSRNSHQQEKRQGTEKIAKTLLTPSEPAHISSFTGRRDALCFSRRSPRWPSGRSAEADSEFALFIPGRGVDQMIGATVPVLLSPACWRFEPEGSGQDTLFNIVDEMKGHVGGGLRSMAFKVLWYRLKSSWLICLITTTIL